MGKIIVCAVAIMLCTAAHAQQSEPPPPEGVEWAGPAFTIGTPGSVQPPDPEREKARALCMMEAIAATPNKDLVPAYVRSCMLVAGFK